MNNFKIPKRAIGHKIPKLDSKCIIADTDEDDEFKFEAYGFTIDEFNEYVEFYQRQMDAVDRAKERQRVARRMEQTSV